MPKTKIGLLGGTFDPPHIVHFVLASEALYQLKLDRLLWVLTPDPPHKIGQDKTALEHRLAMLQAALAENPAFEISRIEIDRPGPHYMVDTVRLIQEQNPDSELCLLIGGDSLRDLPHWRLPLDLVAAVSKIGVMRRPGDSIDLSALERQIPGIGAKTIFLEAFLQDLSSSEIRRRIREGKPYRYYLPSAVYQYIQQHQLYRK